MGNNTAGVVPDLFDEEALVVPDLFGTPRQETLQNPTPSLQGRERTLRLGAEEVNKRRAQRVDLVPKALKDLEGGPMALMNPVKGLTRLGAATQVEEDVVTRGFTDKMLQKAGVEPGAGPSEFGDIGYARGWHPAASAAFGTAASSVASFGMRPAAKIANAFRKEVLQEGTSKVLAGGAKKATRYINKNVFKNPTNLIDYAEKDGYKFINEFNLDPRNIKVVSNDLGKLSDNIRVQGSQMFDSFKDTTYLEPVSQDLVGEINEALFDLIKDPDPAVINRLNTMAKRASKRVAAKGNVERVGDVIAFKRDLASFGNKNPAYYTAARKIGEILSDEYKELKPASAVWADAMQSKVLLENMVGGFDYNQGLRRKAILNPKNMAKVLDDVESDVLTESPELLDKILTKYSAGTFKPGEVDKIIKDLAAGQAFSKGIPLLAAMTMGGFASLTMGQMFGLPGAIGGLTSGVALGTFTPKSLAKMNKVSYRVQKALNTPNALRARMLADRMMRGTADVNTVRGITGRNEEQ